MKRRIISSEKIKTLLESKTAVFDIGGLATMWGITRESAKVEVFRLVKSGILKPIRRGLYYVTTREPTDFEVANALYQPSVISLQSALNHWGILVQAPQTITSIADKSRRFVVQNTEFVYRRVPQKILEIGTVQEKDWFMAQPEKALIDFLYFVTKGLYSIESSDFFLAQNRDWEKAKQYLPFFPRTHQERIRNLLDPILERSYSGVG